jgi:predicted transcriptional regulator
MSKTSISFRTDTEVRDELDALAKNQQRNRSFLINEALNNYLDLQRWQIEHIQKGLDAADRGEFVSNEEMKAKFAELKARCK